MARRSTATDLAGLAGLATLGYYMLKDKKGTPTEALRPEAKVEPDYGEDYAREVARGERGPVAIGEMKPKSLRAEGPKGPAAKDEEKPATKPQRTAGRGTGDAQLSDYIMRRERDKEAGMSRGRREAGPPKMTMGAQPVKAPTREELIAQIPGSSPAGWQGGAGERVTGSETSRNLKNIGTALSATPIPGATAAGVAEKMALMRADRLARMRRGAEGYSPEEALAARAAMERSAVRGALNEADTTGGAIGFKKGGSSRKATPAKKAYAKGGAVKKESKPAAKGWGMARGGRPAKIY